MTREPAKEKKTVQRQVGVRCLVTDSHGLLSQGDGHQVTVKDRHYCTRRGSPRSKMSPHLFTVLLAPK